MSPSSAPLPVGELERLAALARYDILDTLPEEAFDRITRLAAQVLNVPVALVNFVDAERQWGKACYGLADAEAPREDSLCAWAILSDEVMVVPNAHEDVRFKANPMVTGAPHIHLYAGAPLVTADGFRLGTLCVVDDQAHAFGEREQRILQELAAIVIDELELRRSKLELEREAQASAQMLRSLRKTTLYAETLLAVTSLLELGLDPRELTRRVVELVARAADMAWGGLLLVGEDRAEMQTAWSGPEVGAAFVEVIERSVPRGEGVIWQVVERGEPLYADCYAEQPGARRALVEVGVQSVAWVPLGEVGGASFVFCGARLHRPVPWSVQDRALFVAAARAVRTALEHQQQLRDLEEAALTDVLTRLGNRRAFDLALAQALDAGGALSVALIDLGIRPCPPEARDDLLRTVANVLSTALQAGDRVFCLGGDEFALLARPRGTLAAAQARMLARLERVLEIVRRREVPDFEACVGVSSAPEEGRFGSALLRLAEERLYRARRDRQGPGEGPGHQD